VIDPRARQHFGPQTIRV